MANTAVKASAMMSRIILSGSCGDWDEVEVSMRVMEGRLQCASVRRYNLLYPLLVNFFFSNRGRDLATSSSYAETGRAEALDLAVGVKSPWMALESKLLMWYIVEASCVVNSYPVYCAARYSHALPRHGHGSAAQPRFWSRPSRCLLHMNLVVRHTKSRWFSQNKLGTNASGLDSTVCSQDEQLHFHIVSRCLESNWSMILLMT